jgi:2-dehydropantoate 2-reductase
MPEGVAASMKRFAVVGAGGIGGYIAGMLARSGHWVALIARNQNLEAILSSGLHIESPNRAFEVAPMMVTDKPQDVGSVDAIVLAVKAWQVREAALALRPMVAVGTRVLVLQNGVEVFEQLEQLLGAGYALMGVCWLLSHVIEPGRVRHFGLEPTVTLGERNGKDLSPNAKALADAFVASGLIVRVSPDIETSIWEKWVFVAGVSGVGAVARGTFGEIRQCSATRDLVRELMQEVAAVAVSQGINVSEDVVDRKMAVVDTMPASGTSSMQRDIIAGRPSELETIVGAIIRLGNRGNVPTPAANCIYGSLILQESKARNGQGGLRGTGVTGEM